MSVYSELAYLGVRFRPLERQFPPNPDRRWSPFRASLGETLQVLERELRMLHAERIVVQVALGERQIRNDGMPRSDARADHPGVVLAFDSKWGPLQYATDDFHHWEDNLRAIALAMEALRKVDRYGVSKRGEQYTGWKALPASGGFDSTADARAFLDSHGGVAAAIKRFHPDNPNTGDRDTFDKVMAAKALTS